MTLWLVRATWTDDKAERTEQWEVNAATQNEAMSEVLALLSTKPHHLEAKPVPGDAQPPLGPGTARKVQ
jgi:hypothetical protein